VRLLQLFSVRVWLLLSCCCGDLCHPSDICGDQSLVYQG
jgi:hypothetical protein